MRNSNKIKSIIGVDEASLVIILTESSKYAHNLLPHSYRSFEQIIIVTLLMMRHYPTEDLLSFILCMPRTSLLGWIEKGQAILAQWAGPLISWPSREERLKNSITLMGRVITAVIDCNEQTCTRSVDSVVEAMTFSGKYMDNTLVILAAVDPVYGHVMRLSESYPGSANDQQIFNYMSWTSQLDPDENLLADKGFSGARVLTKHRKLSDCPLTEIQVKQNIEIDTKRIIVENLFAFTSGWAICYQKIRYKTSNLQVMLERHNRNFTIVCGVLNRFSTLRKSTV